MTQCHDSAVVILAAGAGTRMVSDTPKVLHTLAGRTMLSYCLSAAVSLQPRYVVVVLGYAQEKIRPVLDELVQQLNYPVRVAIQEHQYGTGHALGCGLTQLPQDFTGTVLVTSSDIPLLDQDTLQTLLQTHHRRRSAITILTTTVDNPEGYGRILRTQDGQITAIVEQADATAEQAKICEINSGVYAFDRGPLQEALRKLTSNNAQHEQYLPDVIAIVRANGQSVYAQHLDDSALVAGVNDRVQLASLSAELNRRIIQTHQRNGVTIVDPTTTWIDLDVCIGRDTLIAPGTQLLGQTHIGTHCVVGPDSTLTTVTVGDRSQVIRCHGSHAQIGDDTCVGPFTYLRPGTVLGNEGKLGAFVEVKNSTIGQGSKVPHLTYVGDADIGQYSNIGASSVFVNYDGINKHRTHIGSHVRTGSDTMFIAPVSVGDGAYTGAGTVLRQDVPPGALAVSAAHPRIFDDWVITNRPGSPSAHAAQAAKKNLETS